MDAYYVEGYYISKQSLKKAQKSGKTIERGYRPPPALIEPFARRFCANSTQEALQMAELELHGGQWLEPPKVSRLSEEERMRKSGAPELPGFAKPPKKSAAKRRR
jgi:hypothetical protein